MTHSLSPNNDEGQTTPPSPTKTKTKSKTKNREKGMPNWIYERERSKGSLDARQYCNYANKRKYSSIVDYPEIKQKRTQYFRGGKVPGEN